MIKFTAEEHVKYARRFEEGFDIPDPRYQEWVHLHHPDDSHVASESWDLGEWDLGEWEPPFNQNAGKETAATVIKFCCSFYI